MLRYFFISCCLITSLQGFTQALSYTDPAQGYLKLLLDKNNEGSYQQVGNFRVIGSAYLYGERIMGSAFATNEKSENVNLSYNLYKQQIDVYPNASNYAILKSASEIDSFILFKSESQYQKEDLRFYSSKLFKTDKKNIFLLSVYNGNLYSLYKSYTASLDFVSTNYIQSDLRQFSIDYNYYYCNNKNKQLIKIKLTKKKIVEEFKDIIDATPFLYDQNFNSNAEQSLKFMFKKIKYN